VSFISLEVFALVVVLVGVWVVVCVGFFGVTMGEVVVVVLGETTVAQVGARLTPVLDVSVKSTASKSPPVFSATFQVVSLPLRICPVIDSPVKTVHVNNCPASPEPFRVKASPVSGTISPVLPRRVFTLLMSVWADSGLILR